MPLISTQNLSHGLQYNTALHTSHDASSCTLQVTLHTTLSSVPGLLGYRPHPQQRVGCQVQLCVCVPPQGV